MAMSTHPFWVEVSKVARNSKFPKWQGTPIQFHAQGNSTSTNWRTVTWTGFVQKLEMWIHFDADVPLFGTWRMKRTKASKSRVKGEKPNSFTSFLSCFDTHGPWIIMDDHWYMLLHLPSPWPSTSGLCGLFLSARNCARKWWKVLHERC